MFSSSDNKGFRITFANGWTVSVRWGPMNYCQAGSLANLNGQWQSEDAEIAAWKGKERDREWYDFGYDQVLGYMSPAEVLEFMNKVAGIEAEVQCDTATVPQSSFETTSIISFQ